MTVLIGLLVAFLISSSHCADVDKEGGDCARKARQGTLVTDDSPSDSGTPPPTPQPTFDIQDLLLGDHYEVIDEMDHDPSAFTQGLTWFDGRLFEGTGLYGRSELRQLDPNNGNVLNSISLESRFFGEGIAYYKDADGNGRIIQITWREQQGYIYDADALNEDGTNSFPLVRQFTYTTTTTEGWGITYWEETQQFVVSDGSHFLHFWDRDTLEWNRTMAVRMPVDNGGRGTTELRALQRLNELEWFHDTTANSDVGPWILANVWYQDTIVAIDPTTGIVMRVYDFSDLYKPRASGSDVFNGISATDDPRVFYVTGKLWPKMFIVRLKDGIPDHSN